MHISCCKCSNCNCFHYCRLTNSSVPLPRLQQTHSCAHLQALAFLSFRNICSTPSASIGLARCSAVLRWYLFPSPSSSTSMVPKSAKRVPSRRLSQRALTIPLPKKKLQLPALKRHKLRRPHRNGPQEIMPSEFDLGVSSSDLWILNDMLS